MTNPHTARRARWLEEAEVLEFDGEVWIPESHVYALMDRELACERRRNAELYCASCKDSKPFRDRETNTFMHQVFTAEGPTAQNIKNVPCYADAIWRNEDQ